ncbi:DUF5990 family protein [Kitasatospora sp. NPDC059722]|uniref:DUF5990 family protein n=1 Tax=Kitasatospora sp. NPDC059722 TaxID=3346925 RepID=UPI003679BE83
MQLRIEATDLPGRKCGAAPGFPGYRDIHVAVQRRAKPGELLDPQPGDAPRAEWTLECVAKPTPAGTDITGRYVQGGPGGRFVYLNWLSGPGSTMFRRAKIFLDAIPPEVVEAAVRSGLLVARLGLTDAKGHPLCAAVRPPLVTWTAGG